MSPLAWRLLSVAFFVVAFSAMFAAWVVLSWFLAACAGVCLLLCDGAEKRERARRLFDKGGDR